MWEVLTAFISFINSSSCYDESQSLSSTRDLRILPNFNWNGIFPNKKFLSLYIIVARDCTNFIIHNVKQEMLTINM